MKPFVDKLSRSGYNLSMSLNVVYYVLIAYGALALIAVICYIPKIVQLFSAFYRPPHKIALEKRRISLVIPARNESKSIVDLFASLEKQSYDGGFYSVNVIVDSEDDPTIGIARAAGANVFVVPEQHCKGDALDGYFKQLAKEEFDSFDAFVIIDADAVLTPDYIEELNNALEYDCQIFLSRKYVKNYLGDRKARTIFTNCSVLTYPQLDDLANNYRTKHKIPMNMCGQGMMIRRDVIEEIGGWPYRTLTEDYELRMDCFLKGFTSMYYPYAIIYTEEVLRHSDSYKRRLRWVTGFSQCDRMYKKQIREQVRERGSCTEGEREFLYSFFPVITYAVVTVLAWLSGIAFTIYFAVTGQPYWLHSTLLLVFLPLAVLYIILFLYCLLCMIAYRDAFSPISLHEKLGMLLYAPIYCMEYFPIFVQSRRRARKGMEWAPTVRVIYKDGVAERAVKVEKSVDASEAGVEINGK